VGGFAEFIPVPARYLIQVERRINFEELAPLTDAGLTPYRGVKKLRDAGALGPNRVFGVFGVGGLGGYAVQYAKLLGVVLRLPLSTAIPTISPSPRKMGPITLSASRASLRQML